MPKIYKGTVGEIDETGFIAQIVSPLTTSMRIEYNEVDDEYKPRIKEGAAVRVTISPKDGSLVVKLGEPSRVTPSEGDIPPD